MLFLATFFPMSDMEEEEGEHRFDFLNDFLRALGLINAARRDFLHEIDEHDR